MNPDELEVAPGVAHENLEGRVYDSADLREALEKAFDYRGDVTLTLRSGETVEGYIFDRRPDSAVRLFPKGDSAKRTIEWQEITGVAFTGRDTAAGKSWEAWMKKYHEKKAAGEQNIQLTPESLD
jgi:hypothetical protein